MLPTKTAQPSARGWAWTLGSGVLTICLAAVAALLPDLEALPRAGLVGWVLLLAGIAELTFGTMRTPDAVGRTAMIAGLITAIAGLLFVIIPRADYLPVMNVVMAWLLVRGTWVLAATLRIRGNGTAAIWLALAGAVDVLLGMVLALKLPITMFVTALFGPTRELVATFALILFVSFAVTGISQVAIALAERRTARGSFG